MPIPAINKILIYRHLLILTPEGMDINYNSVEETKSHKVKNLDENTQLLNNKTGTQTKMICLHGLRIIFLPHFCGLILT